MWAVTRSWSAVAKVAAVAVVVVAGGCASAPSLHDQLTWRSEPRLVPPSQTAAGTDPRVDAVQAEQHAVVVRARVGAVKRQGQRTLLKPGCTITFIEVDGPIGDYPQISTGLRSVPVASPECL